MSFYILIAVILLFLSFRKFNKFIFWGTLFFLSLIAGMRSEIIGVDTSTYKNIYIWISNGILYPIEPAWYFLNKGIFLLGGSFNFLLWIVSLMTLIPVGLASLRCSENPQMSLFFYYGLYGYLNSFNGMRQFVAISFVLLAYSYLLKPKKFCGYLIVASSFHYSAIISIVALFVDKIDLTQWRVFNLVIISYILGLFFNDSMFTVLAGPYAGYLNSSAGYREEFLYASILSLLMSLLYIFTYLTLEGKYKQSTWTKLFLVAIVVLNLTMQLELGARIILYFTLSQIIFYPMYFRHNIIKNKGVVIVCILLYTISIFMKILILGNQGYGAVYPYKTMLW